MFDSSYPSVDSQRLFATTDAQEWAEEFAKVCPAVDRGLMISWFANAIEVGRSAGKTQLVLEIALMLGDDAAGKIEDAVLARAATA